MANSSCPEKGAPVLIVGAGTWGTSIAYRLAKRGYTNITVLDSHDFPSSLAAGNDHNKILEEPTSPPTAEQDDEDYAWSTIETLSAEVWRNDPVYTPHYHPTGFIYAAVGDEAWAKVRASGLARPDIYEPLNDTEAFRKTMPEGVLTGDLAGWKGFIRRRGAGWVEARDVLLDVHAAAARRGVAFITGPAAGRVEALLYSEDGGQVLGARTADGRAHHAHTTVLAAGAGSVRLLDFERQLRPTAWTLAHVPLAADEAATYGELPVLFGADRGFFISPPASEVAAGTPELKICDEHPGYVHLAPAGGGDGDADADEEKVPLPWARDAIPRRSAEAMRALLRATVPQLADRPLRRPRLCWDADTPDRLFLLGRPPAAARLLVAAGGSGNGFMNSPAVGLVVADLLEGRLDARLERILGWRPAAAAGRDWLDTQGRFGGPGRVVDLADVPDRDWMRDPIQG